MSELASPYVISADLENFQSRYDFADDHADDFRDSLVADLRAQGKQVVYLPFATLRDGLMREIRATTRPVVSIDRHYVRTQEVDGYLDITRAKDSQFSGKSYTARPGHPSLTQQLDALGRRYAGEKVAIADDVLFSGDMLAHVVGELESRNVKVSAVLAAVAIGEGVRAAEALGMSVETAVYFNEVEDEVCERDFTALPGAGKFLTDIGERAMYWVPRPYSEHDSWASISEEHISAFFASSVERNVALLGENTFKTLVQDIFGREELFVPVGVEEGEKING